MALPTAPLGQLGNMSMPYSIPTYDKGPNVWEKALAAFLVNAAGGVASQGTENVMSRENAKEFGEQPAGLWERLTRGPKVSDQAAGQRRQNIHVAAEAQKGRDFSREESEFAAMTKATADEAEAKNRMLQQDAAIQGNLDERVLQDMNALIRGDRDIAATNTRNDADNATRLAQIKAEYEARAGLPSEQRYQSIIDQINKSVGSNNGTSSGGKGSINPNIEADARGGPVTQSTTTNVPEALPADYYSSLQELLALGLTQEEASTVLRRQGDVRTQVNKLTTPTYPTPSQASSGIDLSTLRSTPPEVTNVTRIGPPTPGSNPGNDYVADKMRALGYGLSNLIRPQNWRGDWDSAAYVPEKGSLLPQLQSRHDALTDKNSETAQELLSLLRLLKESR